ncbi:GDSL-type esterase/lipase family protein [Corynebacterium urinipleomorphum]|uniref:GDSL-type esterase/lipase family protein n=1 Tax=Corynebacterium urinipleomorphum TaxID=1852380 RepID=UPI000B358870|nr:GDSL-type esterase/lipase family protein [Corynebacterium urinipleomorphum]
MTLRRAIAAFAALAALLIPSVVATPQAAAAPNGNIVAFGDSFVANPDQIRNFTRSSSIDSVRQHAWDYPTKGGCLQAPNNWPRILAKQTGRPVTDWSCSGGNSETLLGRIDWSIRSGDLHRGTSTVLISTGINDFAPLNALQGRPTDFRIIHNMYVNNLRTAANKIRRVAPNARIIMPGMLSITEPVGLQRLCGVNVIPNMPGGIPLGHLQAMELAARDAQRHAAGVIGATFIDIKHESRNNHTCAPDQHRWVAGIIDTTTPDYNMAFHPSYAGSRYVATRVQQTL